MGIFGAPSFLPGKIGPEPTDLGQPLEDRTRSPQRFRPYRQPCDRAVVRRFRYGLCANSFTSTLLGRNASAPEISYWTNVVNAYGPSQAVSGILNSPESQTRIVDNLYLELLGRHADPGGLRYWDGVLVASGLEAVTAWPLVSSSEFLSKHPGNAVTAEYIRAAWARCRARPSWRIGRRSCPRKGHKPLPAALRRARSSAATLPSPCSSRELNRPASVTELSSFANNPAFDLLQIEATILGSSELLRTGTSVT